MYSHNVQGCSDSKRDTPVPKHYQKAIGRRDCITDTPITKYSHKVNGRSNILLNYTPMLKYTVTKSLGVVTTKLFLY